MSPRLHALTSKLTNSQEQATKKKEEFAQSLQSPFLRGALNLHFILPPKPPPVHLLHLQRPNVDPVDGPHVDRQLPPHELDGAERVVEAVGDLDAAGGAEGVFGGTGAELVGR